MQDTVKTWLKQGTVDIFLGYKSLYGHPLPHCFVKEKLEEVDELIEGPARYSLEKIATHMVAQQPEIKIGMLSRDCNQRALKVLTIWNKLNPDNFKTLTVNCCPSNLKTHADCSYLEPEASGIYKKQVGIDNTLPLEVIAAFPDSDRFARWMYEFQKCLKCYGCRNICPVCFCEDCSLEHDDLIGTGTLPPDVPLFHLVRAVHMAGRCIDCGLCEEACPVDIPLRLLYRKVNDIFGELFDYKAGVSQGPSPFSIIGSDPLPEPMPMYNNMASTDKTDEIFKE
jgi:formate dehydrogenase subunit beta